MKETLKMGQQSLKALLDIIDPYLPAPDFRASSQETAWTINEDETTIKIKEEKINLLAGIY